MAKKSIFPDFSERSRKEMEKQMLAETGIDFSLYRTEELGEQIGDLLGVFSWIALVLKVAILVIPSIILYYIYVITPPLTPVDSAWDVIFLIMGVLWSLLSTITLGISTALWFSMKKLSGTTSDLLSLMLDLLEKSAGVVKECTPSQMVRLVTTNGALVFFPLISSAVVAHLAIGKLKIPGTKFIAEKVGSVLAIKLSMTIIDKLGFSAEAEQLKRESVNREKDTDERSANEKNTIISKIDDNKGKVLVDALSLVQSVSSKVNSVNRKLKGAIVKPFAVITGVCAGCAFLPPLVLWL